MHEADRNAPRGQADARSLVRIVLVTDPSGQPGHAIERASQFASAAHAAVRVCIFAHSQAIDGVSSIDASGGAKARERFLAERQMWANSEAIRLRGAGIHAQATARWSSNPAEDIVNYALSVNAGLVVKNASLAGSLSRLTCHALDRSLLMRCELPLMLVTSTAPRIPKRLIAAVDVAETGPASETLNREILRTAKRFAELLRAELHIACCYDPRPFLASRRAGHEVAFESLSNAHGIASTRAHFLVGDPADGLAKLAASRDTDLLVIGSGRALGVQRLVVGAVSERILDTVSCDVLAVKGPPAHTATLSMRQ